MGILKRTHLEQQGVFDIDDKFRCSECGKEITDDNKLEDDVEICFDCMDEKTNKD